jgi:hypothetical protein
LLAGFDPWPLGSFLVDQDADAPFGDAR